ncbi:MAG: 1-phosphofructokinase, partial [Cardiobacterium sp.]
MEVITITANPAIDMTVHVDGWQRDAVNRAQAVDITVGGKGLTVAINLA